ncbi:MAG: 2-amino-4-hydroxy-6-hydroxymethyldihydropteridine diphosphokinase [Clostridium sp.]|nr:2-amino-4-hydroxy-6-hydroxymethyldihydropteridine diphosphokinase [Clostridium sp.]
MVAYLCLGSNMGDALGFVEKGVGMIAYAFPAGEIKRTEPLASEPWGYESPNSYVNLTIRLSVPGEATEQRALDMLDALQEIEREISAVPHRNADGSYRDREIDIDIVAIEGLRMGHPRLQLPHPRAAERDFVRIPMLRLGALSLIF